MIGDREEGDLANTSMELCMAGSLSLPNKIRHEQCPMIRVGQLGYGLDDGGHLEGLMLIRECSRN
jgi:hypothetical protein